MRLPVVQGSSDDSGAPPREGPLERLKMTNDKKLKAKDLANVKGGAAKGRSSLAKASGGRTASKGVNLGSKRR